MQLQELQQELASRAIIFSLDATGKMQCKAPRDAITPALADAIKEHRAALLTALAGKNTEPEGTPAPSTSTEQDGPPALRTTRSDKFRASKEELALWDSYYSACPWYNNVWHDSPFGMALEYATGKHIGSCVAISSNRLIWYYERCQHQDIHTEQGIQPIEPRQFTELLRAAYQHQNIAALTALASNFNSQDALDETIEQARKLFTAPAHREPGRQDTSTEHQLRAGRPARTPSTAKGKGRAIVYADVHAGRAITHTGAVLSFTAGCSLSELLRAIHEAHTCDRLYICGELPEEYAAWLIDAGMWEEYTTGKRGHYFDKEKAENHVARYARRVSGDEIEIRTMFSWLGDTAYTVEQAHAAMSLLNQYLQGTFTGQAKAYATPALTFQQLWSMVNRIESKQFTPLAEDIRALIHGSTGQGRIELCTPDGLEKIPGLYYYDGVFMYSALTWGMPTELATHDYENVYAGKVPARYRIRYTVPTGWQHIGLFMTPKEQVTGNPRDNAAWCYPGEKYQGRTFETWADGSELDIAYNLPESMPAWDITILERIVFTPEKDSAAKKPLDSITNKLAKMRERIEQDARQDTERRAIYKLVRGAVRNILLHGIGSFHRHTRDVTYILRTDEPAPDGYTGRRDIDDNTVWYTVPQATEAYTQQFEHPEWTALIWARCRARMTRAALSVPRECIIALRTDAIAVSTEQPQWRDNEKRGALRQKWNITRPLKAPHDFEALDALVHKHVKGDR